MKCLIIAVCILMCQLLTYDFVVADVSNGLVEIYVAIDQRVVKDYINHGSTEAEAEDDVRRDAEFFLQEVNNLIQLTGTNIGIRVRQMDVLAEDVFIECKLRDGDSIHEDLGLQEFKRYLEAQGLFDSLNYDMALLWTGYNIYGKDDSTAGYASVGSVCTEDAATMVEYDGTFRTVHVTAHEIGHVLGLNHDEDDCEDGYIMAEALSLSTQRWTYSPCSVDTLSNLIPAMTCITSTDSESQTPDEAASDELLDPNTACARARNDTNSYFCKSNNLWGNAPPQGDQVCQRLYCYSNDDGFCYQAYPPNSLICGVDERCLNGECVSAPADFPTPPGTDVNCLYGDSAVLKLSGGLTTTCSDFFESPANRFQCYSVTIEAACCETCDSLSGDIPGCSYGDRSSQCVDYSQNAVCPTYKDSLCCEYCSDWSSKRSADDNQTPPVLKITDIDNITDEEIGMEAKGDLSNNSE